MISGELKAEDKRLLRSVTLSLVAAFSIILFLGAAGYVTEKHRVNDSNNFSALTTASSEIGTISQKLAVLLFGALGKPDESLMKKLNDAVESELQRYHQAQNLLQNENLKQPLSDTTKYLLNSLYQNSVTFVGTTAELRRAISDKLEKREVATQFAEQSVKLLELGRQSSKLLAEDALARATTADTHVQRYYFMGGVAIIGTAITVLLGLLLRLRRELKLRRGVEENLTQCNQELERFSSVVAHDLKAPLTTIALTAKLVSEDTGSNSELMDTISTETNRLREMVQALLHVSHVQSTELCLQSVHLGTVIKDVQESLHTQLERFQAKLTVDKETNIFGDKILLHNVFQNLVENSLKYREVNPPEILISAIENGEEVQITYEDNGLGIEASMRQRVFDPFVQSPLQNHRGGVGLGLSVVKKILTCHGGSIEIVDKEGAGTRFLMKFPIGTVNAQDAAIH